MFRAKQIKRNLRHGLVELKTAEDNNPKINVSLNITGTFLLFKASAFFQIFFLRNFFSDKF